jgi:creatinine amidohydrolase
MVLVPVGATEQHGPHLPLYTDSAIASEIVGRALARLPDSVPAVALPPVWCGKSNEHDRFPGTISLSADTLKALLWEMAVSLYRTGFRKLVFVNGHGGQPQVLEIVARDLRAQYPDFELFPASVWSVPNRAGEFLDERERELGLHAGQAETSLMLALDAQHVRSERLVREFPPDTGLLTPEGRLRYAWLAHDISASGVMGDATRGNAAEGEVVLGSLVEGWIEAIRTIHDFELSRGAD